MSNFTRSILAILLMSALVSSNAYASQRQRRERNLELEQKRTLERRLSVILEHIQADGTTTVSATVRDKDDLPTALDMEVVCFSRAIEAVLAKKGSFQLAKFVMIQAGTLLHDTEIEIPGTQSTIKYLDFKLTDRRSGEIRPAMTLAWIDQESINKVSATGNEYSARAQCQVQTLNVWTGGKKPVQIQ